MPECFRLEERQLHHFVHSGQVSSVCIHGHTERHTWIISLYFHINSNPGIIMASIELAVTDLVMRDGTGLSGQVLVSATVPPKGEVIIMTVISLLHSISFNGKSVWINWLRWTLLNLISWFNQASGKKRLMSLWPMNEHTSCFKH